MAKKSVFIIGGGPAGYVSAIKAAQLGFEVTIAEKNSFGGTCLNRGCIPMKALLHITSFLDKNYRRMGINFDNLTYDLDKFRAWKDQAVKKAVKGVEILLKKNNVNIAKGEAFLLGENKVKVNESIYEPDHIILAMGSEPNIPSFIKKTEYIWTSDDALELKEVPNRLLIIGGGIIGVETATLYNRLGSEVTIFDMLENVGGVGLDKEIANELKKQINGNGIKTILGNKIDRIDGNKISVGDNIYEGDRILLAMGRKSNLNSNISEVGIITNKNKIQVNNYYETNLRSIFAIGDLIDGPMLAHKASNDGCKLISYLAKISIESYDIPSVIYTHPEIASVGLSEEAARKKYDDIKVSRFPISANARANCTKELKGMVKLITVNNRIIGAHLFGDNASEMIWSFSYFINKEIDINEMNGIVFPHPTYSEAIGEAILGVSDSMIHI